MKIGDEVYVRGYVDEIRSNVVIIRTVNIQPYIDIVRCAECKWAKANGTYQWCGRLDSTARITPDDFCSYGERKESE